MDIVKANREYERRRAAQLRGSLVAKGIGRK